MRTIERKSVMRCAAGDSLKNISTLILVLGIIASVIIAIVDLENNFVTALVVLLSSIFMGVFGRTFAKTTNYIQAIYNNVNPDFELDPYIMSAYFYPGDIVMAKDGEEQIKVTVKSLNFGGLSNIVYNCEDENGNLKKFEKDQLSKIQ